MEIIYIKSFKNLFYRKGPKIPCTTCGKVFASVMTVRAHEKTHLNVEYLCDLCGSSFRVKAYLTAHVQKVHMKLKKLDLLNGTSGDKLILMNLFFIFKIQMQLRELLCSFCT